MSQPFCLSNHFVHEICAALCTASIALSGCGGGSGGANDDTGGAPASGGTAGSAGTGGGGSGGASNKPSVGVIWAADWDGNDVKRIDTATEETQQLEFESHVWDVGFGAGYGWVTTSDGKLHRINPKTMALEESGSFEAPVMNVVGSASDVFVSDDGDAPTPRSPQIQRIDPTTLTVKASIEVPDTYADSFDELVMGPQGLYSLISNGFSVARIDPSAGTFEEKLYLPEQDMYGYGEIALDDGSVWIVDQYNDSLHRLSENPLATQVSYPMEKRFDGEMTAGAGFVFINDTEARTIGAFDASTGQLSYEFEIGLVECMLVKNSMLVVALDYQEYGDLVLVDPKNGTVLRTFDAVYADRFAFE